MSMRTCVIVGATLCWLTAVASLAQPAPATPESSAPPAAQTPAPLHAQPIAAAPRMRAPVPAVVRVMRPARVPIPIFKPGEDVPIPIPSPLHSASLTDATETAALNADAVSTVPLPAVQTAEGQQQAGTSKPVKVYWFLSGR